MTYSKNDVIALAKATSVQHAFEHYQPDGPSERTIYRWLSRTKFNGPDMPADALSSQERVEMMQLVVDRVLTQARDNPTSALDIDRLMKAVETLQSLQPDDEPLDISLAQMVEVLEREGPLVANIGEIGSVLMAMPDDPDHSARRAALEEMRSHIAQMSEMVDEKLAEIESHGRAVEAIGV